MCAVRGPLLGVKIDRFIISPAKIKNLSLDKESPKQATGGEKRQETTIPSIKPKIMSNLS
ncbi:hypothetical protein MICAI_1910006 [Microcystis sp. T1-4]|nr:hypothetical protein MICAI_1910006 [Microcystis sp. T1-4]